MHSKTKVWLTAILATLLVACDANHDAFDRSPAQRNAESIAALKAELTKAEHGWRVLYSREPTHCSSPIPRNSSRNSVSVGDMAMAEIASP